MLDDAKMILRYALGLRRFLERPLGPEECRQALEHQLKTREESFLRILERGIFAHPRSPYRRLFARAGIGYEEVAKGVRSDGMEATLGRLYNEGVYVTYEEFKGRRPIIRPCFPVVLN